MESCLCPTRVLLSRVGGRHQAHDTSHSGCSPSGQCLPGMSEEKGLEKCNLTQELFLFSLSHTLGKGWAEVLVPNGEGEVPDARG